MAKKPILFEGQELIKSPTYGLLRNDAFGREVQAEVNSELSGTPAEIKAGYFVGQNSPMRASNSFIIYAVGESARRVSGKYGKQRVSVMLPEDYELEILAGKLPEKGLTYRDYGTVLDFTGRNHDLAVHLYEQLPKELQDLGRLPAVVLGLIPRKGDKGNFGLVLNWSEYSQLRSAEILKKKTGTFDEKDSKLVVEGIPSILGAGNRTLYTSTQQNPSLDNLGLSRLYLSGDLSICSGNDSLADSSSGGRVGLKVGEANAPNLVKVAIAKVNEDYATRQRELESLCEQARADIKKGHTRALERFLRH